MTGANALGEALDGQVLGLIRAGRRPDGAAVDEVVAARSVVLGAEGSARLGSDLVADLVGLGPLAGLCAEDDVTDVLVNGDGRVWVDRGGGVVPADLTLAGADAVRRLAVRLAGLAGRRLDDSAPWVDGELPGGIRLHAVLPPVVADGAHLSLRIPRRGGLSLTDLQGLGMLDAPMAGALREVLRRRLSFVVSGGTGAGKTTLLSALVGESDPRDRVVIVEDVRELAPAHPHVVSLQGRSANVEGVGAVSMTDLVRQSLRMRPDRLVVGEVRGPEVRELLMALNTGHRGGCGTLHANAAEQVPTRFEALGALAGLGRAAVAGQLAGAVELVVHVVRTRAGRRVDSLAVLRDGAVRPALVRGAGDVTRPGPDAAALDRLIGGAP